jgi:hypothetical protein
MQKKSAFSPTSFHTLINNYDALSQLITRIRQSARSIEHLPPDLQRIARDSYSVSLKSVFFFAACSTLLAYIVRLPVSLPVRVRNVTFCRSFDLFCRFPTSSWNTDPDTRNKYRNRSHRQALLHHRVLMHPHLRVTMTMERMDCATMNSRGKRERSNIVRDACRPLRVRKRFWPT